MGKIAKDKYVNVAYAKVTMSAPNVLTFQPFQFAVGVFQGVAIVVHRILYYPLGATLREMVAATEDLDMAVTTSSRLTSIYDVSEPGVVDRCGILCIGVPVANMHLPIITDWTALPMGGKIIAPNPLFIALETSGFTAAGEMRVQMDFTFVELTPGDYIELIQSQLPANIL